MNTEYQFLKLPETPSKGKVIISIEEYMELKSLAEGFMQNYIITFYDRWSGEKTYYATDKDKFVRDLKDKISDLQRTVSELKQENEVIKEKSWIKKLFG